MSVILTQSCSHVYQEHLFMPSKKPYNYKKLKQKKKKERLSKNRTEIQSKCPGKKN